jgi:hypothetical protein
MSLFRHVFAARGSQLKTSQHAFHRINDTLPTTEDSEDKRKKPKGIATLRVNSIRPRFDIPEVVVRLQNSKNQPHAGKYDHNLSM